MFSIAILIGIYSYIIFSLGLLGLLYKPYIILLTIVYVSSIIYLNKEKLYKTLLYYFNVLKKSSPIFLIALLFLQSSVNFIGVLGPELSFDSLWYHLTLPKIYLLNHWIDYIPGSLLYYSAMPKLTEMLYAAGLAFGSEIIAKFIHFSFGILSLIALYSLSRRFLTKNFSFLVCVLFYSNLVVGWMSKTAYIDLARTFFEIMALWGFIEWQEKKDLKWLIESAVMLGLAISTKLLAVVSLFIFSILIAFYFLQKRKSLRDLFICLSAYLFISLLIPLPWFIFSIINAGNPIYPFFSNIYPVKFNINLINPLNLPDPISPLYVIFLPIALFVFLKLKNSLKIISLYSFLAITIWYLTPATGGGRFILPYLPAFSLITVYIIAMVKKPELKKIFVGSIIFLSLFSIIYRGFANAKYLPVILGKESKSHFLANNLNFSFGDFYDVDGYFFKKIKPGDKVLLYGFHNLYYVNFPFIDSSYVKKGDMFNYIAVQNSDLPKRFSYWNLIYYNPTTKVKVYSLGGIKWFY